MAAQVKSVVDILPNYILVVDILPNYILVVDILPNYILDLQQEVQRQAREQVDDLKAQFHEQALKAQDLQHFMNQSYSNPGLRG